MAEKEPVTERDRLQLAYELAFYPPRLNEFWRRLKDGAVEDLDQAGELLDQVHGTITDPKQKLTILYASSFKCCVRPGSAGT